MFRHECKYKINKNDCIVLSRRLEKLFDLDEHSMENGLYTIKSMYFDNFGDKALREKIDGVNRREKFRIRYYNNNTGYIRLEKKSKIDGLCLKENALITAEECRKIIDGNLAWRREDRRDLVRELYAKMCYEQLRPKNVVVYERKAFVYEPGNCRVTLDMNLRGSMCVYNFLKPDAGYMKYTDNNILEVKWDAFLPGIVRDAVQINSCSVGAFSKYAAVRFV